MHYRPMGMEKQIRNAGLCEILEAEFLDECESYLITGNDLPFLRGVMLAGIKGVSKEAQQLIFILGGHHHIQITR